MSKQLYFGPEVDKQIVEFGKEQDIEKKNKIFHDGIRPALVKLIESQMFLYGFYKIDDPEMLKDEALSNLYLVLPKFDPTKGTKAFSYFNVVNRRWFIWKLKEKKKQQRQQSENIHGLDGDVVKNNPSLVDQSFEDEIIQKEFWLQLFRHFDRCRPFLKKKQEVQVLDAIVFLLQNPYMVSIYNKKAVFLYIKEMTGLTTKQVTNNMNRLRELYETFREKFHSGEEEFQIEIEE